MFITSVCLLNSTAHWQMIFWNENSASSVETNIFRTTYFTLKISFHNDGSHCKYWVAKDLPKLLTLCNWDYKACVLLKRYHNSCSVFRRHIPIHVGKYTYSYIPSKILPSNYHMIYFLKKFSHSCSSNRVTAVLSMQAHHWCSFIVRVWLDDTALAMNLWPTWIFLDPSRYL